MNIKNSNRSNEQMPIKTKVIKNTLPLDSLFDYDLYFSSLPNGNEIIGFDQKGDVRYLYYSKEENPAMMRMEVDNKKVYLLYILDNDVYTKKDPLYLVKSMVRIMNCK